MRTGLLLLLAGWLAAQSQPAPDMGIPYLDHAPQIDGDLSDWKAAAFHDGLWDIYRVQHSPWYDPARNRLTVHDSSDLPDSDLLARYYLAWDTCALYLGAEVLDNINDVTDPHHAPRRWYYKDAIAWFVEIPRDTVAETFGEGDHGFAFVADSSYPAYGAWWRHGTADSSYLEAALPAATYRLRWVPQPGYPAAYTLEARIDLCDLLGDHPRVGDPWGLMIVHCDPDGGAYGGHLLLYGQDDRDSTWHTVRLTGPQRPLVRRDR
ncbi:MAG: hypothetical protein OHK0039_39160 [Bacteroidia bacterium]